MTRMIGLLLSVVMMLAVLAGCGASKETPAEDFTYNMANGTVTITGYTGTEREIRIPEKINDRPVAVIGQAAFKGYDLESVYIPDSVKSIENCAFQYCVCLTEVRMPEVLVKLGEWAFEGCSSLQTVDLPESITTWGDGIFVGCTSLNKIAFPDGTARIPDYICSGCTSLHSVDLPDTVTTVGYEAFNGCVSLQKVNLPAGLLKLDTWAFDGCTGMKELVVPANCELGGVTRDPATQKIIMFKCPVEEGTMLIVKSGSKAWELLEECSKADDPYGQITDVIYKVG